MSPAPVDDATILSHLTRSRLAIIEWDADFIVRRWAGGAERVFGWSAEEAEGRRITTLGIASGDDLASVSRVVTALPRGAALVEARTHTWARAGEARHCNWQNSALYDDGGHVSSILSFITDVTEETAQAIENTNLLNAHRQNMEALLESEERFRAMADDTPVIIWVHGPDGGLQFVNREHCEFFGTTLEAVRDGGWQPLVHADDKDGYVNAFLEAVRMRAPFRAEYRVQRADGAWRWIASTGRPRISASGAFLGFAGFSADVTERKECVDSS